MIIFIDILIYCVLFVLSINWIGKINALLHINNGYLQFLSWLFFTTSIISLYNYIKYRERKCIKLSDKLFEPFFILIQGIYFIPFYITALGLSLVLSVLCAIVGIHIDFSATYFICVMAALSLILNYIMYYDDYQLRKEIRKYKTLNSKYEEVVKTYTYLSSRAQDVNSKINSFNKYQRH